MPVNQVQNDANIDMVKRQQMAALQKQAKDSASVEESKANKSDVVEISQMAKDINKYKKMLKDVPEPNEGRIAELKQAVADGTLLSDEALEGAAAAITSALLG